jgi:hypothetical protein
MGAGILPIAIYRNNIYLLLSMEIQDNKWSDFGGKQEKNESKYETALREGYEESNGFFGTLNNLNHLIKDNLIIEIEKKDNSYKSYLFQIEFDINLPIYFNNNSKFINKNFEDLVDKNGFFEKKMIKWFTINEIKSKKCILRSFYKEIIDLIIDNEEIIKKNLK